MRLLAMGLCALSILTRAGAAEAVEDLDASSWGVAVADLPPEPPAIEGIAPYKWPTKTGVMAQYVDPYAFTASIGLKPVAIIDVLNGKKIANAAAFRALAAAVKPGDKVVMRVRNPMFVGNRVKWKSETLKGEAISKIEALEGQIVSDVDDLTGATQFRHKDANEYVDQETGVVLVLRGKAPDLVPTLQLRYTGEEWLFIQGFAVVIGDATHTIKLSFGDVEQKIGSGRVSEWVNVTPGEDDQDVEQTRDMIDALATAGKATIRYLGKQSNYDHELTDAELGQIATVWRFYNAMNAGRDIPTVADDAEE
jgi:hypothetical protein